MKAVPHSDEIAKQMVKRFCDQFIWLRVVHNIYKELFENDETQILMKNTAPSFFSYFNTILINCLFLEFVKITDPVMTGAHENFTVDNLIKSINWPQNVYQELKALSEKTKIFKQYAKDARNKLLAHIDKEIFLSNKTLGKFPVGEDERFLEILERICNITHEVCFGSILGTISLTAPGDVVNLKRALTKALAFDRLLSESTGSELSKLFDYLKEAVPKISPNNGTKGGSKI